jgi:putative FmdB family regulatory protein
MPIYEYACSACGHQFEEWQKITDKPIRTCPKCKAKKVEKLISQTSFHLKGGGWYSDLYAGPKPGSQGGKDGGKDKDGGASKDSGKESSKESTSKESKETKAASTTSPSGTTTSTKTKTKKSGSGSA